ncbi:MAG: efflux RND transporter permease subunit [Xanthomonadaceae bacterium]|nr:efflux RND transporter permease subunit [Xanthomonadaceae bacterium]
MNLPQLSIRRYVLAFMLNAVLVLFGILGMRDIGVDRFPEIEFPFVTVVTVLPGANPDTVDASLTNIIESAVNSVPGVSSIQSNSSPGVSIVMIEFNLAKDADVAFNEVQAKINQVLRQLPTDADPPVVAKVEVGASPVMWLALQGDRTEQQLNQYAANVVRKQLETVDGVGQVLLGGRRERTIRVNLDVDRMAAAGVTPGDVRNAFAVQHLQMPGGFLVSRGQERLIKLDLEFHSTEALAELIVRHTDGAPVRLRDIGEVEDALADYRQIARFNGETTVGLGIVKVSGANTIAIIDEVQRRLDADIRPQLPPGMTLMVASNDGDLINEIVAALKEHLLQGTILAALVVFFFLRSFRSTLIVATAIPVSLLGSIALIYFFGFTFNTMTLLALLLLIGVVVDDAIVVLENVYRHRQHLDKNPVSAAVNGTNEVMFAVIAASLTLISIFGAVVFLGGIIGRFFNAFALVVASGVAISLLVSLTLTPMLCSRYLSVEKKHGRIYHSLDRFFERMDSGYQRALGAAITHRWTVVVATVLVVLLSGWFFSAVDKGFVPEEDESRFVISFRAPLGTDLATTDRYLREIETLLASKPEVLSYFAAIGLGDAGQTNRGVAFVRLVQPGERDMRQQDFLVGLRRELAQIPGVFAFAAPPGIVGGQRGEPLQFVLTGRELDEVARLSRALYERLQLREELGPVDIDLQLDLPQVRVELDRTRAAALGLSAADVAFAINMLAGGVDIAKYNDEPGDGERYDIRVKAGDGQLATSADLARIFVRSAAGEMVRLDGVARFDDEIGPAVITRYDLEYSAPFFATPVVPLGAAIDIVEQEAEGLLPLGYQVKLIGEARELEQTMGYVMTAFVLAIILVYMVLASQFNSFLQPLIVMVAQPLAMIGGVFALWVTGNSLNIFSMIGLVLLIGLVAKNSILLVDLTNQMRTQGMAVDDALRAACPVRLRPVLMTSLTVIFALSPPALGLGAGADTNGPLAIAVIGGMISSTLLTLVVVPAVYSLVEGGARRNA